MQQNKAFKRSPLVAVMLVSLSLILPAVLIWLTSGALSDLITKFQTGLISASDWQVLFWLCVIYAAVLFSLGYACRLLFVEFRTKYTDEGIERPTFSGMNIIYWHDVQKIREITTYVPTIIGLNAKINIILALYEDPVGLLAEIRSRIPESAYPTDDEIVDEMNRRKQSQSWRDALLYFFAAGVVFFIAKNVWIGGLVGGVFGLAGVYSFWKWLGIKRSRARKTSSF